MKIKSTLTQFWKAALCLTFICGLNSNSFSQSTVTISKPGNAIYYEYDNASWVLKYYITNTYDQDGRLLLELHTTPNGNQNFEKTEYIYTTTATTKAGTSTSYSWQNNAWVVTNMSGTVYTYNAANQNTELLWQSFRNGVLSNDRKKDFTYDAAGNLAEEIEYFWNKNNNTWQSLAKRTYTYVQGIRTEQLNYSYNNATATWMPAVKFIFTGWHTPNLQPLITEWQNLDPTTGNWRAQSRDTYIPGANGGHEILTENFVNNTWVNKSRSTVIRDLQGNRTEQFLEQFINNTWMRAFDSKFINTYNSQNDMLEMIVQGQDSAYAPLKNEQKFVYSNFQYFTRALGTSENQKTELALNVYPNPATDKIQIQLAENKLQTLTVSVKDITGKTWQTKTFQASDAKQLNIEALPKGIYLLQLQTEAGSTVKRLVKQ